jgi:hypothetical protein
MIKSVLSSLDSPEDVCTVAVARLRTRRSTLAQAIVESVATVAPEVAVDANAEYQAGRATAIAEVVEYVFDAIERCEWGPIPQALAVHARCAARNGMRGGILARRCLVGHQRFMAFFREEVQRSGYPDQETVFAYLRQTYHALTEHIVASMEHEYEDERERLADSAEQRCKKVVQRLLAEDVDVAQLSEFGYDVHLPWHLGVIVQGLQSAEILRRITMAGARQLLAVPGDGGAVLAWLGGRIKLTVGEFRRLLSACGAVDVSFAVGEPGSGLEGWRQTHHEARVAHIVARTVPYGVTRCADVLPVAGALQSEAIVRMYKKNYTLALDGLRKGGQPARTALRAYFKHGRNASTAGEASGLSRRTIENYLNEARRTLGDPLNLTGLEIALQLEDLGHIAAATSATSAALSQNAKIQPL